MKETGTLPPAIFIGGVPALDFLNSIATPVDEIVEWIGNGIDFLSWMKQAGHLTDDDIKTIKSTLSRAQLDDAANEARALRDWFRAFVYKHKGKPLKRQALDQIDPLNRLLEADAVFWELVPSESTRVQSKIEGALPTLFHLRPRRRWREPNSLLFPLAEEIAKFICSADFRHVKACEGSGCTLLFLDQTRRHGRRWCIMSVCGNRAKAAAFAARAKSARGKLKRRRSL